LAKGKTMEMQTKKMDKTEQKMFILSEKSSYKARDKLIIFLHS